MKVHLILEVRDTNHLQEYIDELNKAETDHVTAKGCIAPEPCNEIRHIDWLKTLLVNAVSRINSAEVVVDENGEVKA